MARALRGDSGTREPVATLADGVRVRDPGQLTRAVLQPLLDDIVIVREAELRETLVRLALEEHVIAEGAGALALAAGRRVPGKRKCAVVSGGNIDALALAALLSEVRPRPPRKPRRRGGEAAAGSRSDAAEPALAKKVAVAKRRPTATLAPSSSISAPLAPPAPQHVSEEEFTW